MNKNNKGFTLTELLVSFALLTVVIIYLLKATTNVMMKENDLLMLQEYNVFEATLLNKLYDDMDGLNDISIIGEGNEINFIIGDLGSIYKTMSFVNGENEKGIYYDNIFYELPENVKFKNDDFYNISKNNYNVNNHIKDYYIINIPLIMNKKNKSIKFIFQNTSSSLQIVKFNALGGELNLAFKTVIYNSAYGELPTPSKEGYTFDGWYTSEGGGEKITSTDIVSTNKNQTLYAHWLLNSPVIVSKDVLVNDNVGTLSVTYNVNGLDDITKFECVSPSNTFISLNNTCNFPVTDEEVSMCITNKYGKSCSEPKSLITYLIKDGTMLVDFSTKGATNVDTATLTKQTNYLNMQIGKMSGTRQGIYTSNPINLSLYDKIYIDSSVKITVSSSSGTNPSYMVGLAEYPDVLDKTAKVFLGNWYYNKSNVTSDDVTIQRDTRVLDTRTYTTEGYLELRKNASGAIINTNIYNIYMLKS